MTVPETAGATLYAALPPRAQVHIQRTRKFDHDAAQAFDRGWTLDQLTQRITAGDYGTNPGGTIAWRLQDAAETDPPRDHKPGVLPFCSPECRDNAGWILDLETGLPTAKCPCRQREHGNLPQSQAASR